MPEFWTLLDDARRPVASLFTRLLGRKTEPRGSADPERLRTFLKRRSTHEVIAFVSEFERLHLALNTWRVWGAGYIIAGGMSDDAFHYFKAWIIGRGQEAYETALIDPDALGPFVDDPEVDNEELLYVVRGVLAERDEGDLPELDLERNPVGEPFDEEAVERLYPRLAAQFWNG
ncbi:DUF4240 domain-containing protein [bacterium]|nr:MAG: DUF4240 domain-containing protein [bacterium]